MQQDIVEVYIQPVSFVRKYLSWICYEVCMSKKILIALEKLNSSLNRADNLLAFATELRASHLTSTSKLTDLIYPSISSPVSTNPTYLLRSKPILLKLKDPVFIAKIELTLFTQKSIRLEYVDTLGQTHTQISDNFRNDNINGTFKLVFSITAPVVQFSVSTVEGEVTLRRLQGFLFYETATPSNSKIALSNHIKRLHYIHNKANTISELLDSENDSITRKKEELQDSEEAYEAKASALITSIANKQEDLSEVETEFEVASKQLDDCKTQLSESTATLTLTREEVESLAQSSKTYKEELDFLSQNVRTERSKLKQLQRDVDVFSEDLKAFTGETRKQQWFYGIICSALLVVLVCITYSLFERAGDLIVLFDQGKVGNIWHVILSRLPFMFAVLGIVTFIAEGMRRCINQVVVIHEQRLVFLRLSIVAREVVDSSVQGQDLTNDQVVKLRTKLKLAMLRQHMEKDLGDKIVTVDSEPSNVLSMTDADEAA